MQGALLLGVVLVHELGHSLVARRHGIKVSHITLWPLGGVAWMEEIPEDSRVEGLVAIAGPATNLALALLAAPLLLLPGPLKPLVFWFIAINLALGIFNLVPAFPMDGGRLLRAFLARQGDFLRATERAVSVGKWIALAMAVVGLYYGNLALPLIAVYVWWMGQKELFAVRARAMGPGWPFGAFSRAAEEARQARNAYTTGRATGTDGFESRPTPPHRAPGSAPRSSRGFSDEEIESLERYRGRLKQDWREED
jgi:Zn-dependent protease